MKAIDRHPSNTARRMRETARLLLIYALLAGGSMVFALPFVWMLGSSFKVDREMFGRTLTLWPERPVPAAASPYLDGRYHDEPSHPAWPTVRPTILAALADLDLGLGPEVANRNEAPGILAPGIFERLYQTMPRDRWDLPDAGLQAEVAERVTPALAAEVLRTVLRSLAFGPVRVRSFDLQERELTADLPISEFWGIISGPARFLDRPDATPPQADLAYDFRETTEREVVIQQTLDLPFEAERLFRIQISLTPDDTWHAVHFVVERNGRRFEGTRPEYIGRFLPQVVTLQEFGPMDAPDSNRIKLWIPYREVASGPEYEARPDKVRVTVTLRRQSQLGAWYAKCIRNYRGALQYIPFWRYAATSAFLVVFNILGNLISCSLVAYAFARLQWPGRNLSFGVMLATMMIPPQVTMIPYFLIVRHLGWYNTLTPLWVISFFGNAFNIFLLRQFMKGIPRDLEDAAKIDGCNFFQIYWYVIVPLIKPTLACIAIFTFMGVWNDFMGPLIFLADQRLYPLSLGLYALNVQAGGDFGMMMAGSLLMTLPVILLFFFAQKYFIQGVTLTGMKG